MENKKSYEAPAALVIEPAMESSFCASAQLHVTYEEEEDL